MDTTSLYSASFLTKTRPTLLLRGCGTQVSAVMTYQFFFPINPVRAILPTKSTPKRRRGPR